MKNKFLKSNQIVEPSYKLASSDQLKILAAIKKITKNKPPFNNIPIVVTSQEFDRLFSLYEHKFNQDFKFLLDEMPLVNKHSVMIKIILDMASDL